jgi:Putative transmembrane protein (PGPGW)
MKPTLELQAKSWRDSNAVRYALISLGWILVIGAIVIAPLPGPGALVLAPIGLALILKNSLWAKKRYSRFARSHPQYGLWADWALRRKKVKNTPPFPDIRGDIMYLFRRDDIDKDMP